MKTWKAVALLILLAVARGVSAQDVLMNQVVYHHQGVENSGDYQKGNAFQKDFLLAMQLLKESHPAFADGMQAPFSIAEMTRKGYQEAQGMKDSKQLMRYLQGIFTKMHDGHTMVTSMMYDNSAVYPVTYYQQDGHYYLWKGTEQTVIYLGQEINHINGVPVAEVVDAFSNDFSYENAADREQRLRDYVFPNLSYWTDKPFWRKDSTLMITFKNGMTAMVRPLNGHAELRKAKPRGRREATETPRTNTSDPFVASIDEDRSIAYLQLNTCFDPYTTLLILGMRGVPITEELTNSFKGKPNFHEFLKDFFTDVADLEIKTLVVDLRDNSGGCSLISYELLSWLYPIRQLKCVSEAIRYSPLYQQFYAAEADGDIRRVKQVNDGIFSSDLLYDADTDKAFSALMVVPEGFSGVEDNSELYNLSSRRIFRGDVYFLQNEKTFSAAADIILMARDNGIGKVIGTKGSYRPSNYSSALSWQLPNTGIQGMVSHRACFRPDRSKLEEAELMPDVLISETWDDVLQGRDQCWQWVTDHAAGK
ncbi:MAG: hypothetical protein IJ562_01220 [Prevotella sp.]|nr:hypothetical protein [Prevotella sp.]